MGLRCSYGCPTAIYAVKMDFECVSSLRGVRMAAIKMDFEGALSVKGVSKEYAGYAWV